MADVLNADFWNKAYLLEFKDGSRLTDAFTFSVPPENEEFSFPQRKSETKTFGGVVIADYGNDTVQINLSGSTINQELKLIYKSNFGSTKMTGEQEIFYLRDLLRDYGKKDKLKNKQVYLYSLNGGGNVRTNPKWWRIYVSQLDITRSKEKPFCYNYKFSAIGDPEVTKERRNSRFLGRLQDAVSSARSTITGAMATVQSKILEMQEVANELEELGANLIQDISESIEAVKATTDVFEGSCNRYVNVVNGIVSGTADIASDAVDVATEVATDTVMLGDKVLSSVFRYYPTLAAGVWNSALACKDAWDNLFEKTSNMEKYWDESSMQMIRELFEGTVSDRDISDVYSTLGHDGVNAINVAVMESSRVLNNSSVTVKPGDTDENDEIIVTYGYKVVRITDAETSWDQLAQDYYGNPDFASIIAMYNNGVANEQ